MFCKECGTKLDEQAKFCSECGTPIVKAAAGFQESQQSEIVLMKGLCNRVRNPLYVENGSAILTNKRFIYLKHSLPKLMLMGVLVNLTEGDYEFGIPLDEITFIGDGRQGISKTIIIRTKDEKRYNFYVTNREEWKIKLQNAVSEISEL
ncbi:MAG: zinc ribbon domain-containing protein [Lachnospiraceae bacterium]|nr:zinc ribbon domain-containing protein [Lachnospiraceae bacterium]